MKRLGNIFDLVIDRENLAAAFNRVCKGKRGRGDIRQYAENLEENLNALHRKLVRGTFRFGKYNFFKISDSKERMIAAAAVDERIVHHALIAVIGERLERSLVDKSYACRKGKGQWQAVAEARRLARKHEWCLKMDIRHFFDSIDHGIMLWILARKIKDRRVLELLRQLVESYEVEPGKGLPIGNLTSQYFANLYLDGLDRFLTQRRRGAEIVRYMDDVLVFGGHDESRTLMGEVPDFLRGVLELELKPTGGLHRTERGVNFLGTRIFPDRVELARKSKVRFRRKIAKLDAALERGELPERVYQERATALFAFARKCDSHTFRQKTISEDGQGTPGRRAWRCVVQQQQQQQLESRQYFEGLGLSRCLLPRSSKADGTHLNRPFSRSSCGALGTTRPTTATNTPCPCGAGRRVARRVEDNAPYRAERHAGYLQVAYAGDVPASAKYGNDATFIGMDDVEHTIGLKRHFMNAGRGKVWETRKRAHRRKRLQQRGGFVEAEVPSRCRFQVAVFGDVSDVPAKLVDRMVRPRHVHRPNSLRIISRTSALEWHSPRANCDSPIRRSSRTCAATRSSFSHSDMKGSQSMMLSRTDVGRPFCVTMMGRCVRRVFSKYSPSLPRHSVKEMTSSERIGRRGPGRSARRVAVRAGCALDDVFVRMVSAPVVDADSVPFSRHVVQGEIARKSSNALAARCTTPSRTGCQSVQANLKGTR